MAKRPIEDCCEEHWVPAMLRNFEGKKYIIHVCLTFVFVSFSTGNLEVKVGNKPKQMREWDRQW